MSLYYLITYNRYPHRSEKGALEKSLNIPLNIYPTVEYACFQLVIKEKKIPTVIFYKAGSWGIASNVEMNILLQVHGDVYGP